MNDPAAKSKPVWPSPFAPPGKIAKDAQLPMRRATRVLLETPELVAAFKSVSAPYRAGGNTLSYGAELHEDEPVFVTVEHAIASVVNELVALRSQLTPLAQFVRHVGHGAVMRGLELVLNGDRTLQLEGGSIMLASLEQGFQLREAPIMALSPVGFKLVAGGVLAGDEDTTLYTEVPQICAVTGEPGEVVKQPAQTYRVDLLTVAPITDEGIEFYLVLGGPTKVKKGIEVDSIPTPTVPASYRDQLFPLYRIVSRQGSKTLAGSRMVASRLRAA